MNLKFMRRVSERERAIRQFVIVKNKLISVIDNEYRHNIVKVITVINASAAVTLLEQRPEKNFRL